MGYQATRKPLTELSEQALHVELSPAVRELNEVVVQSITGLSVLQQVQDKITQNYDTAAFNLSFFLREWVFHDGAPIRVNEALYEGYRGHMNANTSKQVRLLSNRNRKYYAEYQGILSTFPHWTGYEMTMNRTALFDEVDAWYTNKENFPVPGGTTYHDFVLTGTNRLNGREVYIIHFDQKNNSAIGHCIKEHYI